MTEEKGETLEIWVKVGRHSMPFTLPGTATIGLLLREVSTATHSQLGEMRAPAITLALGTDPNSVDPTTFTQVLDNPKATLDAVLKPTIAGGTYDVYVEELGVRAENPGKLLGPDGKEITNPLTEGQLVTVVGETRDRRDAFAPDAFVVTPQYMKLAKKFFDNYANSGDDEQWGELCIYGTPGCGKSCAAKILAAEIRNRIPGARVFMSRGENQGRLERPQFEQLIQERNQKRPIFVFVDQLLEKELDLYANRADDHFYVILLASANYNYFRGISSNQRVPKKTFEYAFLFKGETTDAIMGQLTSRKRKKLTKRGASEEEAEKKSKWDPLPDTTASQLPFTLAHINSLVEKNELSSTEMFNWANGQPLSIAGLFLKGSRDKILKKCVRLIDTYFTIDFPSKMAFYFGVLKMLKASEEDKSRPCIVEGQETADCRFVNSHGQIISPLAFRAYQMYFATRILPPELASPQFFQSHLNNSFECGWVLERISLNQQALQARAAACLNLFDVLKKFVPPINAEIKRLPFVTLNDVNALLEEEKGGFFYHFIPVPVVDKIIDCLHVYFAGAEAVIIGHQITRTSAQKHKKSVNWHAECKVIKELSVFKGKTLQFLLMFGCTQAPNPVMHVPDPVLLEECKHPSLLHVAEYPVALNVEPDVAEALQLDPDMTLGPRVLTLELQPAVKSEHCACKKGDCTACSCRKHKDCVHC